MDNFSQDFKYFEILFQVWRQIFKIRKIFMFLIYEKFVQVM